MKITHVVDTLQVGGAETLVVQLCAMQRDAGHEPQVACVVNGGVLEAQLEGMRVQVYGPRRGPAVMWALWREFVRSKPDVVHCHNANATILAALAARLAGVPAIISTRHGLVPLGEQQRREARFWRAARFCDRVIAVCDAARENLLRWPASLPAKIETIRNGAWPAKGTQECTPPLSPFVVITVARLNPAKDQSTLLRAFAIVQTRVADAELWIVGDGALRPELERLTGELGIADHVRFWGERADAGALLAQASLFVLSSISEGLPVSLLEAMAAGLPQVVTRVGGMPEVVAMCGAGDVVAPGDPAALAAAVVRHALQRERSAELRPHVRKCWAEHFSAQQMANAYDRVYRSCLARRS